MGILGEQLGDRVEVAVPPRSFAAADPAHHVIPMFRFLGGRVAESWYEGNDLEVAQQLGAQISAGEPTRPS